MTRMIDLNVTALTRLTYAAVPGFVARQGRRDQYLVDRRDSARNPERRVQLARALGAQVFATGSAGDQDLIARLGATPIDYRAQSVEQYVASLTQGAGFDLVVDTVGGATLDASFAAVKHFGHVVSALGWGTHSLAPLSFREATRLAEAGKLMPNLDPRRFDLGSAELAYDAITNGAARGKIVVDVA